jgi:hypothetical protein
MQYRDALGRMLAVCAACCEAMGDDVEMVRGATISRRYVESAMK